MGKELRGRRNKVAWLVRKLGMGVKPGLAELSDREFRDKFEILYRMYRDKQDYTERFDRLDKPYEPPEMPKCIRCGQEVEMKWVCLCEPRHLPLTEREDDTEEWDRIVSQNGGSSVSE